MEVRQPWPRSPPNGPSSPPAAACPTLLLLCAVQFLDIIDSSIMNVALPSIRADLGFSQQGLQWVLSGYLVTYGGFLLLGGRAADLFGRRRLLVAGTVLFAVCSLAGGLADQRRHAGRRPRRAGHRRGDDGARPGCRS